MYDVKKYRNRQQKITKNIINQTCKKEIQHSQTQTKVIRTLNLENEALTEHIIWHRSKEKITDSFVGMTGKAIFDQA